MAITRAMARSKTAIALHGRGCIHVRVFNADIATANNDTSYVLLVVAPLFVIFVRVSHNLWKRRGKEGGIKKN